MGPLLPTDRCYHSKRGPSIVCLSHLVLVLAQVGQGLCPNEGLGSAPQPLTGTKQVRIRKS
jgi:hypothetical protein